MITNNNLQKLIENKKFQLPEEYLCSRAKTDAELITTFLTPYIK